MLKHNLLRFAVLLIGIIFVAQGNAQRPMEKLDRSVVAQKQSQGVYVNWRIPADEYKGTSYRLYRNGTLIHETGAAGASNYTDIAGTSSSVYTVTAVKNDKESAPSKPAIMITSGYIDIPLRDLKPLGKTNYIPNDATSADLDGDGEMEIILKRVNKDWSVANTNYSFFEAYKLDGTFMWAIDVGPNICSDVEINIAAFDFDGDGKAEVFLRTSEGTVFGDGKKIGDVDMDGKTNYRATASPDGFMNDGPEFLSLVDGMTGVELDRVDFIPRGQSTDWGDNYGHRANKFFFGAPFLDGLKPSLFIGRGIYTKTEMRTYDIVNKKLVFRWEFKSGTGGAYFGQGNHNYTIADVDGDGKDEITWGSMCVDDNGKGLYSTQMGHGDAMHVSDLDPYRKGQEVFSCLENSPVYGTLFRDAANGKILHHYILGRDCGRACAGNISDKYKGAEIWGGGHGYSATDLVQMNSFGVAENFTIYWDGDLTKELLDHSGFSTSTGVGYGHITKFNGYGNVTSLLNANAYSNNYTKGTPSLQADIIGDWREEAIWWRRDSMALRIYTTTHPTEHRIYTLLHDHHYRQAICWQMCGYNQPPHTSFYLGSDFPEPIVAKTTNGMKVWKGLTATWNSSTANWMDGDDAAALIAGTAENIPFATGQRVLLDARGVQKNILLTEKVEPEGLTVSGSSDYTIAGSGELAGAMWLDKIGEGVLTLQGNHSYTGITDLWEGTLIITDTLSASPLKIRRHADLELTGTAGGGISTEYNARIYAGGKMKVGRMTIRANFNFVEGARLVYDLSATPDGNNDFMELTGTLNVQEGAVVEINPMEGALASGSYALATIEAVTGDLSKIQIEGLTGTSAELQYDASTKTLFLVVKGVRSASTISWTGSTNGVWDLASTKNWSMNGEEEIFVGNDTVIFPAVASSRSINISETLNPVHMEINSALPYAFDGAGKLTGTMSLLKKNTGLVNINNRNDFTGKVVLEGGTLNVKYPPTATNNGGIGTNNPDPAYLVLSDSAVLQFSTANEITGRGITFSGPQGGVLNVPVSLFWDGTLTGTKMTKKGAAVLNIGTSNSGLQETVLREGTIKLNSAGAVPYGPGRKITMYSGILETVNISGAYLTSSHHIEVPERSTATVVAAARCEYNGTLTGGGTLNWVADFIRAYINGDWSAFSGRINITTNGANSRYEDKFIVNTSRGFPNATINLGSNNLIVCYKNGTADNGTTTIKMGMLTGVAGSVIYNAGIEAGGNNSNGVFAGNFTGVTTLRKIGTGIWTLSGQNANSGTTTVSEGSLIVTGKLGTGTVNVQSGASFTLNGTAGGSAVVANGATMVLSGTLAGSLNLTGTMRGTGTVGNVSLLGTGAELQPGGTIAGKLTFNSNLTVQSGARLSMQVLGGYATSDQLKVGGALSLGGTLEVSSYVGTFAEGDEYKLFDATSISGQFDELIFPELPDTLQWDVTELYTLGVLKISKLVSGVESTTLVSTLLNNPSDGQFILRSDELPGDLQIQVTDMSGRVVLTGIYPTNASGELIIDLSGKASGVYLLNVANAEGNHSTHRLIKR